MSYASNTILAIAPGARELGIAVFQDKSLRYYAVKTIRDRSTKRKVVQVVNYYIERTIVKFHPNILALKQLTSTQEKSATLYDVMSELRRIAQKHKITMREYASKKARRVLCRTRGATKRNAAQVLSLRYPELVRFLKANSQWERQYYERMFDAIAIGLVCAEESIAG